MTNYLALDCREFSICKAGGLHGQKRVCSMLAMATATANAGKTQVRLSGSFFSLGSPGISVSGELRYEVGDPCPDGGFPKARTASGLSSKPSLHQTATDRTRVCNGARFSFPCTRKVFDLFLHPLVSCENKRCIEHFISILKHDPARLLAAPCI